MADVATKEPKKATDLAAALGVGKVPLSELRQKVDDVTLARAWAAGDIEFGHRKYVVTGPVGKIGSVLVVEQGEEWPDRRHEIPLMSFGDFLEDPPPAAEKYKRYEWKKAEKFGEEPVLKAVEISREEALRDVAVLVRLTKKGTLVAA